jgi:hypothetical protein
MYPYYVVSTMIGGVTYTWDGRAINPGVAFERAINKWGICIPASKRVQVLCPMAFTNRVIFL